MKRVWMCMVCLLLCLFAGCGQEELYIASLPRDIDGTVVEVDEENKEIAVEITSPDELWSYEGEEKVDCLLKKGEIILTKYSESGDFENAPPKAGMYVRVNFLDDEIAGRDDFQEKNGYIYIDSYNVQKNISFIDGKWSEGTYD